MSAVETVAALVLAFLAAVALVNLANGTFVDWLKAKFLHIAPAGAKSPTFTQAVQGKAA